MPTTNVPPETLELADKSLRFIFGDGLHYTRNQITPQAAAFSFEVVIRVDRGARAAYALFKLYESISKVTEWKDIPDAVTGAVKAYFEQSHSFVKSAISVAFIAVQHQRNMQMHLTDPETFPCPEYWHPGES